MVAESDAWNGRYEELSHGFSLRTTDSGAYSNLIRFAACCKPITATPAERLRGSSFAKSEDAHVGYITAGATYSREMVSSSTGLVAV